MSRKPAACGGVWLKAAALEQCCWSRSATDRQPQTCKSSTYLSKAAMQETQE